MSGAEETDKESLQERLKRAEREGERLAARRAELEASIASHGKSKAWVVGLVASAVLGVVGFAASSMRETRRIERQRLFEEEKYVRDLTDSEQSCELSRAQVKLELMNCGLAATSFRLTRPPPGPSNRPPCTCEAGDPLCSCL